MEEQELKDILGKRIKFFRLRRQFSQADLAEKANISITFLSNIERGNNFPQTGTLCNLAKALDVEVWELFKPEEVADEQNTLIDRISQDFARQVNLAMEAVYKRYKVWNTTDGESIPKMSRGETSHCQQVKKQGRGIGPVPDSRRGQESGREQGE